MLKSLAVKNFTVFSKASFNFAPGINVIIGENGLGKSHVLKLCYASAWLSHASGNGQRVAPETKQSLQKRIAEKLVAVFRPDSLGRLAKREQGRTGADVDVMFSGVRGADFGFTFATNSKTEVALKRMPTSNLTAPVIFFPTKEVISMFPRFASLYRDYHIEIDETYYDLCLALERPLLRGPRYERVSQLLEPLEKLLEGSVRNDNGRFVLGNMEMPLVAEGIRKLAMVAYLIANGSLMDKATLYWDEPETNLNPKLISKLANILALIARQGTQVVLATHSLFLLKEIDLQIRATGGTAPTPARFFALQRGEEGVIVHAGDSLEQVEPIAALDAEIEQANRYESEIAPVSDRKESRRA
jgi:energy-coupling factor transporter ATP-binding protein EcfA2